MGDSDFDDDELFKDLYGEEKESKPEIPAKNEQLEKESGAGESEEAATDGKNAEDSREEKQSIPSPQPRSVDATSTGDDSYGARQSAEPTAPVEAPQERQHTEQKPAAQEEQQSPFNREDGKMFIGGLNWETTDESLRDYFEQFGEVLDCTVMRDSTTGRSRGFGFLTFKDPKCVQVVMSKEHHLDGKIIDPKRAIPREEQEKTAKMFVGGVPADCTEEEFRDFFNQFGRVLDATLMMDKDTGRPRGFGFVTFENEAAVENTMSQPYITIHGKPVEVKRATPKASMRDQHDRHQQMPGSYGQGNQYFAQNMNMYGGMTPAMMAQYYRQMQQYMEAVRNMPAAAAAAAAAASGGMPYPQGTPGMPSAADWAQQQQQMQAASSHYDPSSGRGGTPNSNTDSYDGGNKPEYGSRGQGGGRSSSNRQRYRGRRGDNRGGSGNGGGAQSFHPYRR